MATTVLLRVEEAAEQLRLSRAKTAALIAAGELPSIKIGRSRRVLASALIDWVERRSATSGERA